jgi:hypothetical protein
MVKYYTEDDFEIYYQRHVRRDDAGNVIEDVEEFWERMLKEPEEPGW